MVEFIRNTKVIWLMVAVFYFLIQITSFHLSPLPWFDEVYIAAVSKHLLSTGSFVSEVTSFARENKEALSYGPVFYVFQALSFSVFGVNTWAARLPSLLAGAIVLFTIVRFSKANRYSKLLIAALVFTLAVDPWFNNALHGGRPDILALAFALLAVCERFTEKRCVYIGLFASLAYLTHPRSVVLLLPLFISLFWANHSKKELSQVAITFGIPILLWIFYAHGDPINYIDYYLTAIRGNAEAKQGFIGLNRYIPLSQFPLIIGVIGGLMVAIVSSGRPSVIFRLLFGSIVLFHLFLRDYGSYSIMILPYYYLLFLEVSKEFSASYARFAISILGILYGGFFIYKTSTFYQNYGLHQSHELASQLEQTLPSGSNIIGPATFYYLAENNDCQYQLIDKYASQEQRRDLFLNAYDYDYIMVPYGREGLSVYQDYLRNDDLTLCLDYQSKAYTPFMAGLIPSGWLTSVDKNGYSVKIYRRNKKKP